MLDGLLEKGYRVLVNAGDDAHFEHPADRFGGWVEVHCERLDPEALLEAVVEREGPHEPGRRGDYGGGVRYQPVPRLILPHHGRRSRRPDRKSTRLNSSHANI